MKLIVSPEAERHIGLIDAWWRENRPAAPELFHQSSQERSNSSRYFRRPGTSSGRCGRTSEGCLRSTRFHVYYRVRRDVLEVVAVWSALRGTGPDFTALR